MFYSNVISVLVRGVGVDRGRVLSIHSLCLTRPLPQNATEFFLLSVDVVTPAPPRYLGPLPPTPGVEKKGDGREDTAIATLPIYTPPIDGEDGAFLLLEMRTSVFAPFLFMAWLNPLNGSSVVVRVPRLRRHLCRCSPPPPPPPPHTHTHTHTLPLPPLSFCVGCPSRRLVPRLGDRPRVVPNAMGTCVPVV